MFVSLDILSWIILVYYKYYYYISKYYYHIFLRIFIL